MIPSGGEVERSLYSWNNRFWAMDDAIVLILRRPWEREGNIPQYTEHTEVDRCYFMLAVSLVSSVSFSRVCRWRLTLLSVSLLVALPEEPLRGARISFPAYQGRTMHGHVARKRFYRVPRFDISHSIQLLIYKPPSLSSIQYATGWH